MSWLAGLFVLLFVPVIMDVLYLYLFVFASIPLRRTAPGQQSRHRFAILIPAHNEAQIIDRTVGTLKRLQYPVDRYDIYVVADHCSDTTAEQARAAGAICFERQEGSAGSKAAALTWLQERVFTGDRDYDAIVLIDADTQLDPQFLCYMDAALSRGDQVIQGRNIISNPEDGSYPALAWTLLTLDNRFLNRGRSNLGGSAQLMGYSVCFRADVLRRAGWAGNSLTEDCDLRLRLLLEGICIRYVPEATANSEAPQTWADARRQRTRWLRGTHEARKRYTCPLVVAAFRRRKLAILDGALQSVSLPYSPLVLVTAILTLASLVASRWIGYGPLAVWSIALVLLALYPFLGLALEQAPGSAYRALLFGPFFIVWRTGLELLIRLGFRQVVWVRTPRRRD